MKKLKLVVSLPNETSYQLEQSRVAKETAAAFGVDVRVLFADNDPLIQSKQIIDLVQSNSVERPDAILFEPLTPTALSRVAEAAVRAGIGWVVLNSEVDYLNTLRAHAQAPAFLVTRDDVEIGRTQGKQFAALLPAGGTVLCVQGPATSVSAQQRTSGMEENKPGNIKVKTVRSPWTEPGAHEAVAAWLRLSSSRAGSVDLVGCQQDGIARGARKAFLEIANSADRKHWLNLPLTGIDGLPQAGQMWVDDGSMTATIVSDATTRTAIELTVRALRTGIQPPARTVIESKSYPQLERLTVIGHQRRR